MQQPFAGVAQLQQIFSQLPYAQEASSFSSILHSLSQILLVSILLHANFILP